MFSRPTTARPGTGRTQTAVSMRHEASYIFAVFQSRGVSREVGIAALDKDTGKAIVAQVSIRVFVLKTVLGG